MSEAQIIKELEEAAAACEVLAKNSGYHVAKESTGYWGAARRIEQLLKENQQLQIRLDST